MRKKTIAVICMLTLIMLSDIGVIAAEQPEIKNLNFQIPDVWEYSSESIEDDVALYYYKTENETLLIRDLRYEDEYNEDSALLYDILVGTAASGFSENDEYVLMEQDEYEIDGCSAENDMFLCKMDGVMYLFECTSINTGYSIVDFLYQRYLGDESIGLDSFKEMIENLGVGESDGGTSNSAKKTYTKYASNFYKVGEDIPEGEYIIFAEDNRGYFCVSSDSNQNDITFNDNFDYNSIITINNGEYLELSRCYAIPFSENPDIDSSGTGMFKTGTHISAGEYKLEATNGHGYYCIYPNSRHADIVTNDNFEGQNYITVSDGQYLVLSGCKFAETPVKLVKSYTDSETIKKAQEALNAAGYDCGTPDGIAGNGTKAAIEKFQTDKGLTVTGTITDEVLTSLGIN